MNAPVVPSGLCFGWIVFHGLTPMASSYRHFVAESSLLASVTQKVASGQPVFGSRDKGFGSKVCLINKHDRKAPKGNMNRLDDAPVVPSGLSFGWIRFPWAHAHGYIISPLRG